MARVELVPFPVICGRVFALRNASETECSGQRVQRGDDVLAIGSLVVAVLAGVAGIILLVVTCRLMGLFPDRLTGGDWAGSFIVLGLSLFCFFEAYRFYRFFARSEIRDRYYARHKSRREMKS